NQSLFNTRIGIVDTCFGSATSFALYSGYNLQSAVWDFGDGTTSTELNPTHVYAQPGNYTVTVTAGNSVFTLGRTKGLTISARPTAFDVLDQSLCVESSALYQLSKNDDIILGGQTGMRTSYYISLADAEADINALPESIQVALGSMDLFGRVSNLTTGCYDITGFTVFVSEIPTFNEPSDYEKCASAGWANFDLTTKTQEMIGNAPYIVSYHTSESDAHTTENPLGDTYFTSSGLTVFVRIENPSTGCYAITSFELITTDECKTEVVYDFPKFFTPNGDG